MRPLLVSVQFVLVLLVPVGAAAQLSRLVLLDDLEKEEGVVEFSATEASLGRDVAPAGDVDGDGLDDILIGAAGDSRVFLIYGRAGLPRKLNPYSSELRMSVIEIPPAPSDSPAVDLGGGADVNGDGLSDFVVGAEERTAVIFGSSDLPAAFQLDDVGRAVPGVLIAFHHRVDRFVGVSAQNAVLGGDLNGDGIGEILLGDPEWSPDAPGKGIVHVIFGSGSLQDRVDLEQVGVSVPGFTVSGLAQDLNGPTGDGIGISVQYAGDVDGDGLGDVGIAGSSCSRGSYLVFGRAEFPPFLEVDQIPGVHGVYFEGMSGSMRAMGDLNGDGYGEFTLQHGAGTYDIAIVGGRPRSQFPSVVKPEQLLAGDSLNTVIRETTGSLLCPARLPLEGGIDVDGDGRADLLVGGDQLSVSLPRDPITGQAPERAGVVYLFPTSVDLPRELPFAEAMSRWAYTIAGKAGDLIGNGYRILENGVIQPRRRVLGLLSDFDGDGSGELLLAAPAYGSPGGSTSRTYLIPMRALNDPGLELTEISPGVGQASGGDWVRVTGRGMAPGTQFFFGSSEAEVVSGELQSSVILRVPPWSGGALTVDVTARRGARTAALPQAFRYAQGRVIEAEDIGAGVAGGELFTRLQYHFDLGEVIQSGPPLLWQIDAIQDFNGDGTDDIAIEWEIGNPDPTEGADPRVWGSTISVVFGGPHLAGRTDFFDTSFGITFPFPGTLGGDVEDKKSLHLSGSGDVDGDGVGDLAVWTIGGSASSIRILYGGPDLPTQTHPSLFPRRTTITGHDGYNESRIVQDLDGGGNADLLVTAYGPKAPPCGSAGDFGVFILRGEDLRLIHDVDWNAAPKRLVRGNFQRIDRFESLDANGDGLADLAFQAKACDREGLLILFGGSHFAGNGEILLNDQFLDAGRRGIAIAGRRYAPEYPSMGYALARSADLNGDGADEIIVGSPLITGSVDGKDLVESGEAYVVSAKTGLAPPPDSAYAREWAETLDITPSYLLDPASPEAGVLTFQGVSPERRLGFAVAGAGDLNGDGIPDIAVGEGTVIGKECAACTQDPRFPGLGRPNTYISFGEPGLLDGSNRALTLETFAPGLVIRGAGYYLAGGHDVNGDGAPDLLLSRLHGSIRILFGGAGLGEIRFRRGDVDLNGAIDISDAIRILGYLFLGDQKTRCLSAADVDDDGKNTISDAIALLGYLFLGGAAPQPPFPDPGRDPTPDSLDCGGI